MYKLQNVDDDNIRLAYDLLVVRQDSSGFNYLDKYTDQQHDDVLYIKMTYYWELLDREKYAANFKLLMNNGYRIRRVE